MKHFANKRSGYIESISPQISRYALKKELLKYLEELNYKPKNARLIASAWMNGGIKEAVIMFKLQLEKDHPSSPAAIFACVCGLRKTLKEFEFEKYFNWELYNSSSLKKIKNGTNPLNSINAIPPLGYLDFLKLMSNAKLVLTDSGGIQEETSILKIPCVTIRKNTERPVTVEHGTNRLVGTKKEEIVMGSSKAIKTDYSHITPPPLWDGKAAKRIVEILVSHYH